MNSLSLVVVRSLSSSSSIVGYNAFKRVLTLGENQFFVCRLKMPSRRCTISISTYTYTRTHKMFMQTGKKNTRTHKRLTYNIFIVPLIVVAVVDAFT